MNTSCPSCGAVYNVAAKDIGRKLKCKKCSTALKVTEDGLEVDGGTGSSAPVESRPVPAAVADEADIYDDDDGAVVKKKKKGRVERGPGINPLAALNGIGGIPTILFAFGTFLVIVFTSFPIIGHAGSDRAAAYVDKLQNEKQSKIDALAPKKKQSEWTEDEKKKMSEEAQKITEDYEKRLREATLDAESTKISNRRDVWMEQYGLMFGFLFLSFGCIGYLRTEQPLVLKILAAVVLGVMMIVMFGKFGGCGGGLK